MTGHEVFDRIEALIREVNEGFDGRVTPASRFREDLGMDSLTTIDLITAAERAFDTRIPYEELDHFTVVDDLTRFMIRAKVS